MTETEQFITQLYKDIITELSSEDKIGLIIQSNTICCTAKALLQMRGNIITIYSYDADGWQKAYDADGWQKAHALDITNPNCDIIGKFIDVVNFADIILATKYRYGR